MPSQSCVQLGTPSAGVTTYVLGVSHDADASMAEVRRVLRQLRPEVVCVELPPHPPSVSNAAVRDYVRGEGAWTFSKAWELYAQGYCSASLERWARLDQRTDHFTEYRRAQAGRLLEAAHSKSAANELANESGGLVMDGTMVAAITTAAEEQAEVRHIDAPLEVTQARLWNQSDLLTNLWGMLVRWSCTTAAARAPCAKPFLASFDGF